MCHPMLVQQRDLPGQGVREQLLAMGAGAGAVVRIHSAQEPLLCPQTPRRQKRLFCRYHNGNRAPELLIAPFKEEDEWDSPHIVRYYDVMSDEEIERIKEIAKPKVGVLVSVGRQRSGPLPPPWGPRGCALAFLSIQKEYVSEALRSHNPRLTCGPGAQ